MPHQCIGCDETYEDGTDEVLSGCTNCGGTTFQFIPDNAVPEDDAPAATEADASADDGDRWMGGGVIDTADSDDEGAAPEAEDSSQHAARTEVIDDLPVADATTPDPAPADDAGSTEEAPPSNAVDLDALRQELNRQFEGIKILSPGQYEINLTRLFEREECIIALQEDGRYEINIPGSDGKRDINLDDD